MIDTDKYKCPHCKTEYDENDVWHDVIDLQLWKRTSICEGCFEEDGGNRYKNSADIEGLTTEVKRLRETIKVAITDLEQTNLHEETREDLLELLKEMIE